MKESEERCWQRRRGEEGEVRDGEGGEEVGERDLVEKRTRGDSST